MKQINQLPVVGRITSLKDMGFKLSDIIKILEIYDDSDKLASFLEARWNELEIVHKQTSYQMMLLDTARNRPRTITTDDGGYADVSLTLKINSLSINQ